MCELFADGRYVASYANRAEAETARDNLQPRIPTAVLELRDVPDTLPPDAPETVLP